MKNIICCLLLLICQQSFSHSTDSISIKLKKLRSEREIINTNLLNLKKDEAASRSEMQKLDDRYYVMLVNLDSLTGISISMENKSKKTKADEQKLTSIKRKQDSLKESLISMEEQRLNLQDRNDHLKVAVKSLSMQLSQLDKQMQQLEKIRH